MCSPFVIPLAYETSLPSLSFTGPSSDEKNEERMQEPQPSANSAAINQRTPPQRPSLRVSRPSLLSPSSSSPIILFHAYLRSLPLSMNF
mmetsp:Transcript_35662/g.65607  ORF Transcript_35662/g.65607 Transcript_35662/m.65607 type:complete len:89 (-) Transcript_35662:11-277(-)